MDQFSVWQTGCVCQQISGFAGGGANRKPPLVDTGAGCVVVLALTLAAVVVVGVVRVARRVANLLHFVVFAKLSVSCNAEHIGTRIALDQFVQRFATIAAVLPTNTALINVKKNVSHT